MSRLGNLFGMSAGGDDGNDSLKYSAPKEPKKGGNTPSAPAGAAAPVSPAKAEAAPGREKSFIKKEIYINYI